MKLILTALIALAILPTAQARSSSTVAPKTLPGGWKLTWHDEFKKGTLDESKWNYELGVIRNPSATQTYVKEAVKIKGGKLVITTTAKETRCSTYVGPDAAKWWQKVEKQPYASGSITTRGKVSFEPESRLEVRARIPKAKGSWPAIWLIHENGWGWPACGETDIMEHVTQQPNICYSTFHWGKNGTQQDTTKHGAPNIPNFTTDWHVYVLEWTNDLMVVTVDDKEVVRLDLNTVTYPDGRNPFRTPGHLILNTATGGTRTWAENADPSQYPCVFEIDYVRYYRKDGKKPIIKEPVKKDNAAEGAPKKDATEKKPSSEKKSSTPTPTPSAELSYPTMTM